jgi:hypothetical protein
MSVTPNIVITETLYTSPPIHPSRDPSPLQTLDRYRHTSQHQLSLTSFLEPQARATRLSSPLLYLATLSTFTVSGPVLGASASSVGWSGYRAPQKNVNVSTEELYFVFTSQ